MIKPAQLMRAPQDLQTTIAAVCAINRNEAIAHVWGNEAWMEMIPITKVLMPSPVVTTATLHAPPIQDALLLHDHFVIKGAELITQQLSHWLNNTAIMVYCVINARGAIALISS
eukprot:CAMPEP_0180553202 /NCGR_PEP_ID=MMETSP1036_2-20121128/74162_1 /TAXON_ID=632150 /ORGANISM="Azadinium spinosum, Strain 3D9" /LENGTH=113 /DNA_ID=CAMNT_0022568725 /DNA_START=399 /DNA_END=743 /DNA_ORIENTATION=-